MKAASLKFKTPSDQQRIVFNYQAKGHQVTDMLQDNSTVETCSLKDSERPQRVNPSVNTGAGGSFIVYAIPQTHLFRTKNFIISSPTLQAVTLFYENGDTLYDGMVQANVPLIVPYPFGAGPQHVAENGAGNDDIVITCAADCTVTLSGDDLPPILPIE